MKTIDQKWYFNDLQKAYQLGRLGYFGEVYQIISEICGFGKNSELLEIGAGSGIATDEMFEKWHSNITLIEPGDYFVSLLKQKYYKNDKITIESSSFENYYTDKKYDGIVSATAFHWIDKEVKYRKAFKLLNNDGYLVLYWNYYSVFDNEINKEIQDIYNFYEERFECDYYRQKNKIGNRKKEIESCEFFSLLQDNVIEKVVELSANEFINLLNTFVGHKMIDNKIDVEIKNLVVNLGGTIGVRVLTNLEIAKKRDV